MESKRECKREVKEQIVITWGGILDKINSRKWWNICCKNNVNSAVWTISILSLKSVTVFLFLYFNLYYFFKSKKIKEEKKRK